jgi:transcriptional regulator with XRE-family HTH domain
MTRCDLVVVGRAIRQAREKAGLSQEGLAHEAGLHRTYVGGIERGERNVGVENLIRVARALKIPPSCLLKDLSIEVDG